MNKYFCVSVFGLQFTIMDLYLPVLILLGIALISPFAEKVLKSTTGWVLSLFPLGIFIYFLTLAGVVGAEGKIYQSASWIPFLDVNFSFYLDGLSYLFALLITGIGALILVYSGYYMKNYQLKDRFYFYLMVFMLAMFGLVMSGNLITMFVFWELTSISSFMLIGFFHEKEESRNASLQALLITSLGGLALLSGIVLIYHVTGTFEIPYLLNNSEILRNSSFYPIILALLSLGVFTKSAQFPFHFWLPGAMAGPSPVSAFLHSATMVKAGVYLFMRFSPVLGGTPEWRILLTVAGVITMFFGAYFALVQTDLKRILAYTTISALGTLVLLTGIGTIESARAAVIFLVSHSLYKGALFMVAGSIDKKTGTRDIRQLGGLGPKMPFTAASALISLFSMAGIPPFIGFIGKELIYEAKVSVPDIANFLLVTGVLSNAFMVAVSGIFAWKVFFDRKHSMPKEPEETPVNLWLGPAVLAVLSLVLAIFPGYFAKNVAGPAVRAITTDEIILKISLWHGFNKILLFSIVTIVVGVLIFLKRNVVIDFLQSINSRIIRFRFSDLFSEAIKNFILFTKRKTSIVQHGKQRLYLLVIFLTGILLLGWVVVKSEFWLTDFRLSPISVNMAGVSFLIIAATIVTVVTKSRITAIISMGVTGYGLALIFLHYSAPDVAITQILADTLIVIFFVMIIYHLPRFQKFSATSSRVRDGVVAVVFGTLIGLLALIANQVDYFPAISEFFNQNSYPLAHGRNVVNVILVDFRALDTLGEITVLAIAAVGVFTLITLKNKESKKNEGLLSSGILQIASRYLKPLLLILSVYVLIRGHNLPGGGFIGGLMAAGAYIIHMMAFGSKQTVAAMKVKPFGLIAIGLLVALLSGFIAVAGGDPFLTGLWIDIAGVKVGTPLMFDTGVYLTVLGVMLAIMLSVFENLDTWN